MVFLRTSYELEYRRKDLLVKGEVANYVTRRRWGDPVFSCIREKNVLLRKLCVGRRYMFMGKFKKAEQIFQRLLEEARETSGENTEEFSYVLLNLGYVHYFGGNYEISKSYYEEVLQRFNTSFEYDSDFYNSFGLTCLATGDLDRALYCFSEAQKIWASRSSSREELAAYLNNSGLAYFQADEYDRAIQYFERAIDSIEGYTYLSGPRVKLAAMINNLAAVHWCLGDLDEAMNCCKRVQGLLRRRVAGNQKTAKLIETAKLYVNLANIGFAKSDYDKSIQHLELALRIQKKKLGKRHLNNAGIINNIAQVYMAKGDYLKAIEYQEKVIPLYERGLKGDHYLICVSLINLSINYFAIGDYENARELISRAFRESNSSSKIPIQVTRLLYLTWGLYNLDFLNQKKEALDSFKKALDLLNGFILSSGSTANTLSKTIEYSIMNSEWVLSMLISLDSDPVELEEAYEALLNAKVIGYQVAMNVYLSILSGNHPQLSEKFDLLCIKRAEYSNLILKNPTGAKEREEALLEEIDSLERELAIEIPELETDIESRIVSLEKMRGSIPESSVLLDFYHYREVILGEKKRPEFGKGKYGLFKVKREGELELIDLGYSDEIDEKIKVFREEIVPKSEMTSKEREKGLETVKQLAGELFDSLISKALTNEKIERIMISPDGMLNFLPFETLVSENKYLVEEFKITYLSSPKDIVRFNNIKGNGTKDIHIYSHPDYDFNFPGGEKPEKDIEPPETKGMTIKSLREKGLEFKSLEFSGKYEVDSISRAAEGTSLNLKDPKTKEAAHEHSIREIKKPTILHISTHGFFLDKEKKKPELMELQTFGEMGPMIRYDDPLKRSGLVLAGVNRVIKGEPVCEEVEDGILTAYDIVSLDIYGAELVVLSACDTGIGEIKTGQGVMGFRRSFTLAGVKTLVMSLWEVPTNETAILMENFYDNLFRGKGKADSLREAQLKMMKEDYDDPYYWGAFIVQGENNIIRTPEEISSDWQ